MFLRMGVAFESVFFLIYEPATNLLFLGKGVAIAARFSWSQLECWLDWSSHSQYHNLLSCHFYAAIITLVMQQMWLPNFNLNGNWREKYFEFFIPRNDLLRCANSWGRVCKPMNRACCAAVSNSIPRRNLKSTVFAAVLIGFRVTGHI